MDYTRPEDRRAHPRKVVMLPGKMFLADGSEHPCIILDVSLGGVAVMARHGMVGEKIAVYAHEIGRLEGSIVRQFQGGFGIKLTGNSHAAEAFARQFAPA